MTTLDRYFTGAAGKRLVPGEVDLSVSHQHELNGANRLRSLLGDNPADVESRAMSARFVYLGEDEEDTLTADGRMTWYDSRRKQEHRSAEYRLYVYDNPVYAAATAGDLIVIGLQPEGEVAVIVAQAGTTAEQQVRWLFGMGADLAAFSVQTVDHDREVGFAERVILDALGIETAPEADDWLDRILEAFPGGVFPATAPFSAFARGTMPEVQAAEDPDGALLAWMNREEMLFRTLERHVVSDRLRNGFADDSGLADVDGFISYSLSVHNRRKSRAGRALESHIAAVFDAVGLPYAQGAQTENRSKPDFLFPDGASYHNPAFPEQRLTMLGAKSTCKDRWRQVLAEAQRIRRKHLLTLEPSISVAQTDEMEASNLQLVLPEGLHPTYSTDQQQWLMDLGGFIALVQSRA